MAYIFFLSFLLKYFANKISLSDYCKYYLIRRLVSIKVVKVFSTQLHFLQNDQVPASGVYVYSSNMDFPCRIHTVSELCKRIEEET